MSTRLLQAGVDHRIRLKRTRVDGMQTALLELKRQLKSAAQKEQRQQTTLQSMALDDSVAASLWEAIEGRSGSDGAAPSAAAPPPPPPPPLSGLAGREAVLAAAAEQAAALALPRAAGARGEGGRPSPRAEGEGEAAPAR